MQLNWRQIFTDDVIINELLNIVRQPHPDENKVKEKRFYSTMHEFAEHVRFKFSIRLFDN